MTGGAEVFSEMSQSTVRGDGNPLAGMTEMDKLGIQASGSALETMSNIVDMGGSGNIGMQASLHDRPIGADLVASMASMVEDAGGVFAAMGDVVLQAADETERLGTIELAMRSIFGTNCAWCGATRKVARAINFRDVHRCYCTERI